MNLFKKTTASIALVALVSGIFSTGAYAASSSQIEAANMLAADGIINDHSDDTAGYNLDQNVLRQEIAAVARGIAGLPKKDMCDGSFTDVSATTPNNWACYSVEALLDADLIAANTMFKPEKEISKSEAVGMMVKAAFGDEYAYDAGKATSWQEQVVEFAVSKGVVANFTNYDTPATRGFVFEAGANAIMASEEVVEECDEVSQLLGLCGEDDDMGDDEDDSETPVIVDGDNVLMAELSADTPAGTDLPESANGVEVLKFDVTAGSEDVSVTGMELERTGFGESAADEAAVYTEDGRASKVKSFSDSDDMANLTFSPAVVVKAGETRTLTVKVNTSTDNGEFAVSVANITASSTVDAATIVSNYFDVKNVTAAELTISNEGVNANVKAGEEQADVAEFKLENAGNLSTDVDITVSSITLKEIGSVDQEDVLENLTLTVNNEVVATVAHMTDKYVTFNFDPIVIEDDKNESFTVKADIMGGAGDDINFVLDNVIDITASASKYNAVNIGGTFDGGTVDIDAGELTLYAIDAERDEIRQDKANVILGQIKIVNVAGKNLELQNLGVELTASSSGVLEILENVEFEMDGTSYDLSTSSATTVSPATFSDTDLGIVLPQGTTILTVRADTLDNLTDGQTITMALDASVNANFRVEETEDDEVVDDITPSSLSFDAVEVKLTSATAANVPLADVEVVKGAQDLVALQFEIEAGKASSVTADKIKVLVTASGSAATKDEVSEIALYKGSVSESNLLDKVSGSKLASGYATFDGFEVEIAADATQTFIVTLSTVDTTDVVGMVLIAAIDDTETDIDLEDDENDVVTLASATLSDKKITVKDSGKLTLTADSNNTDNENAKTILAGEEVIVFSADTKATNEEVSAETVVFTLDANLKNIVKSAKLYLDDTVVATASNSDVTSAANSTITFDNISSLEFPVTPAELKLAIATESIGYEKIGEDVSGVTVTNVAVSDAEGVDSGENVTVTDLSTTQSNSFDVVPLLVTASASNTFGASDNTATLTFAVDDGDNTNSDGTNLSATMTGLTIEVTSITATGTLTLTNSNSDTVATVTITGNGTFDLFDGTVSIADEVITNGEVFTLETTAEATFKLTKDGVDYTADASAYSMSLNSNEVLGTYDASN